jgi:hypothetical protein
MGKRKDMYVCMYVHPRLPDQQPGASERSSRSQAPPPGREGREGSEMENTRRKEDYLRGSHPRNIIRVLQIKGDRKIER